MRFTLTLFVLSLLITACEHTDVYQRVSRDAQLRKAIAGRWQKRAPSTERVVAIISFGTDGTYQSKRTLDHNSDPKEVIGTWRIENTNLTLSLDKASEELTKEQLNGPYLGMWRYRIVRVDDSELVLEAAGSVAGAEMIILQKQSP